MFCYRALDVFADKHNDVPGSMKFGNGLATFPGSKCEQVFEAWLRVTRACIDSSSPSALAPPHWQVGGGQGGD